MLKQIIYMVKPEDADAEVQWLRDNSIFASRQDTFNYLTLKPVVYLGMIVDQAAVLTLRLRVGEFVVEKDYKK